MREKLIFIGPCFPFKGGVSKHSARLGHRLAEAMHVTMHTYVKLYPKWLFPGRSEPEPTRENNDVPSAIRDLSFLRPWTFFLLGRRIRRDRNETHAVVLTWWTAAWAPHSLLLLAGIGRTVPVVLWCHNVFDHDGRGLLAWLVRRLLTHADGYVIHSRPEQPRLARIVGDRPIGITDLPPLYVGELDARTPSPPALSSSPFRLLFFGFIRPYKGLDDLIEALVLVRQTMSVELLVCGECWGNARSDLSRQIHDSGLEAEVTIRDEYLPDERLGEVFGNCDLVVLPYREATGSGVASIANLFSKPALVTDVGALPCAITPGRNGWVCRPSDPPDLARAIIHASRNPIAVETIAQYRPDAEAEWKALVDCILATTDEAIAHRSRP